MKLNSWLSTLVAALLLFETEYSKACNTEGDIRLVNGRNKFEGRVEVCQAGEWKTVCDRWWDDIEARVVCRQLQFSGISESDPRRETSIDAFGEGSGGIVEVEWRCVGTETNLLDCPTNPRYCDHKDDAGVYCFGSSLDDCIEGSIRLRDGDGSSGRVEVCLDGHWGTVCDDGWDSNDATTVCRELGYTDIERAIPTRSAYFGQGSGPIHLSRADCRINDTKLLDCTIGKTGMNGCRHREDAGVICMGPSSCKDGEVRLVGGDSEREGRVEICYNRVWGTVCDNGWDEMDANVVCQQLGFGTPATISNSFEVGEGPPLLFNVTCNHTHTNLSQCVHPESIGLHDCVSRDKRAGVICPQLAVIVSPSTSYVLHSSTLSSSADVYSTATSALTTERKLNTEDVVSNDSLREDKLQIILSAAGGVLALVVITTICMCFIVVVIARRRENKTKPRDGANTSEVELKENEAYIPTAHDVKTLQKNEAYGQLHNNCIETQKNEAYGQVTLTDDITTLMLMNGASGTDYSYEIVS